MARISKAKRHLLESRNLEIYKMYNDPQNPMTYREIVAELAKRPNKIYHMTWQNAAQIIRRIEKQQTEQSSVLTS